MNHTTGNEIETKRGVFSKLTTLTTNIPKELGTFEYHQLHGHVESCAKGQLLNLILSNSTTTVEKKLQILEEVSNWLAEFKKQTAAPSTTWTDESIERYLTSSFQEFTSIFGENTQISQLFERCLANAKKLIGQPITFSHAHYDFAPWNIYYDAGFLTIIDWEYDRENNNLGKEMPLYDFLYFVNYWNTLGFKRYTLEEENEGFKRLFLSPSEDPLISKIRKLLNCYTIALNLAPEFIPICLVYLWTEQSIYQHKRRSKLDLVDPQNPRAGNRMVKQLDMLAESSVPRHSDSTQYQ